MPRVECGFIDDDNATGDGHLFVIGPTLWVDIGYHPSEDDVQEGQVLPPEARAKEVAALIDTGATTSCIDRALAEELKLPIADRKTLAGVAGEYEANMYLAHIYSPAINWVEYGLFAGVGLEDGGQIHKVLIGRTFLRSFVMIYDGMTGRVSLMLRWKVWWWSPPGRRWPDHRVQDAHPRAVASERGAEPAQRPGRGPRRR